MNNNEEYTPTTPAERAAMARARETINRTASRAPYTNAPVKTAPKSAAAEERRFSPAERAEMARQREVGVRPTQPKTPTAQKRAPNASALPAKTATVRSQGGVPIKTAKPTVKSHSAPQNPDKSDTNEFPSYVRAGKRGGYKPPKPKKRKIAPFRRRKLNPRFKSVLLAVASLVMLLLFLLLLGVRYTKVSCESGEVLSFFGIVNSDGADSGWISSNLESNGKISGGDTINYKNGDIYVGGIVNFMRSGNGVLTYENGDKYEGMFSDNQKNGTGVFTYANGDVYEGGFRNDKPDGHGKTTYANGDVFEGEFAAGRRNGEGTFTSETSSFTGMYENDIKSGYGEQSFANGDKYAGNYENDMRNGQGTYTFANGEFYTGNFKDNQLTGNGTYTWPSGRTYSGKFENGTIVSE